MRQFQHISTYNGNQPLPKRSTANSAGYDFVATEEITIQPGLHINPTLIPTHVKAQMETDEVLILANRSSNPKKAKLLLANGIGVIDSDYYNNSDNEGHIYFQFWNTSDKPYTIHVGDKIGQGYFQKFLTVTDDNASGQRTGGFGSTGK